MKNIFLFIIVVFTLWGCNDDEIPYVFPKDYFPAYPETYWVYSDGTTVKVAPGYHRHKYYEELEYTVQTDEVYVPKIDEHYVYGYEITQDDNRIPLKELLSESNGADWEVGYWQNGEIRRQVINKDTTVTLSNSVYNVKLDSTIYEFDSCIVVIEYYRDTIDNPWLSKEIYAPKVGLIREEIKRGGDSLILRELVKFYISQNI